MDTNKPDFTIGRAYLEETVVKILSKWRSDIWWWFKPQDLGMWHSYHVEYTNEYGKILKYYVIDEPL